MIRAVETASAGGTRTFGDHSVAVWYLISRCENNRMNVLTVFPRDDEETVPIFGTQQMAGEFLRDGGFGAGWHVRESTAGELISLLLSLLSDVNSVALDPPDLTSMERALATNRATKREFMAVLMGRPLLVPVR